MMEEKKKKIHSATLKFRLSLFVGSKGKRRLPHLSKLSLLM